MYKLIKLLIFISPPLFILYLTSFEENINLEFILMSFGFLFFAYLGVWYILVLLMRIRILYYTTLKDKGLSNYKIKYIDNFYDGLAMFSIEDLSDSKTKYGFINKKGQIVIQAIYDNAERFSKGQTVVNKSNKKIILNANEIIF